MTAVKKTTTSKILSALKRGFPVKSTELTRISPKAPARISELRQQGYNITYNSHTKTYALRGGVPQLKTFVRLEVEREQLLKTARSYAREFEGGLRGKAGRDFMHTVRNLTDTDLRDLVRKTVDNELIADMVMTELIEQATVTG